MPLRRKVQAVFNRIYCLFSTHFADITLDQVLPYFRKVSQNKGFAALKLFRSRSKGIISCAFISFNHTFKEYAPFDGFFVFDAVNFGEMVLRIFENGVLNRVSEEGLVLMA